MSAFRKRPVEVEATQWFKNGDHPEDGHDKFLTPPEPSAYTEGKVVRYYRHPNVSALKVCCCGVVMHDHGWIDTVQGGHIVCPGDWIITDDRVVDRRSHGHYYPCKPDIFEQTYKLIEDTSKWSEPERAGFEAELGGQHVPCTKGL